MLITSGDRFILFSKLDKIYKIKHLFMQKLFGINPSSVMQYVR